jgi:hypothetical protein
VLDSDTLIAVRRFQERLDLISPTGQLLQRLTTDHEWMYPRSVSVHDGGGIVTVIDSDRNWSNYYVMCCMTVSESRCLSLKWTSEPKGWARNPVIVSGVVIAPCSTYIDCHRLGSTIIVLSLDSGRQLMNVPIHLDLCPDACNGICVYGERLFMGCDKPSGVAEFQLAGKCRYYTFAYVCSISCTIELSICPASSPCLTRPCPSLTT